MEERYEEGNLTMVCGYEVPKTIHVETKKMLRKLKRNGVLIFEHDDGSGKLIRDELQGIAGAIGMMTFSESHRFVIFDEDAEKKFTGQAKDFKLE